MINHNRYCFIKKPIDRKQRRKMFAAQYCVTPTKRPGIRFPEKATSFLRDVKRRSLRVKRSKSLVINPPGEKRKSGKSPPNLWQESLKVQATDPSFHPIHYSLFSISSISSKSTFHKFQFHSSSITVSAYQIVKMSLDRNLTHCVTTREQFVRKYVLLFL